MEYLYFPGCSLETSASNYDKSVRKTCEALGITLKELEDWNCCGATNYISVEQLMGLAISARNFALAEKLGYKDMVVVCSGCLTTLNKVNNYINESLELKDKVNEALQAAGLEYNGKIKVRHLVEVLAVDYGIDKIAEKIKNPLKGLKIAAYSGCQLTRPYGDFDDKEYPQVLDNILKTTGAEVVDFEFKARCCGGMLMTTKEEAAQKLVKDILEDVSKRGADCIAVICPLCQIHLEGYQSKINSQFNTNYNIPIIPFTQILGLALGVPAQELAFNKNFMKPKSLLSAV